MFLKNGSSVIKSRFLYMYLYIYLYCIYLYIYICTVSIFFLFGSAARPGGHRVDTDIRLQSKPHKHLTSSWPHPRTSLSADEDGCNVERADSWKLLTSSSCRPSTANATLITGAASLFTAPDDLKDLSRIVQGPRNPWEDKRLNNPRGGCWTWTSAPTSWGVNHQATRPVLLYLSIYIYIYIYCIYLDIYIYTVSIYIYISVLYLSIYIYIYIWI